MNCTVLVDVVPQCTYTSIYTHAYIYRNTMYNVHVYIHMYLTCIVDRTYLFTSYTIDREIFFVNKF